MRVILTGGGTGGHIHPAVAIADVIRRHDADSEILFVGAEGGMENAIVPEAGYPIRSLRVKGIKGGISEKVQAAFCAVKAVGDAGEIIREFLPDVVIGTGGYASYPILRAAIKAGIPTLIHESNAIPGKTVKALARKADRVLLNFREAGGDLPRNAHTVTVGNPIRRGFYTVGKAEAREKLGIRNGETFVLSFGGSLGATAITKACAYVIRRIDDKSVRHVHVTGKKNYDRYCNAFPPDRCTVYPYLSDMPLFMSAADIVVCRAGAVTISEIATLKKCAILIPSPYVAADHQTKNAEALERDGSAFVLREGEALPQSLLAVLQDLISNPEKRSECEKSIGSHAVPDADERIYREIEKCIAEKRKNFPNPLKKSLQ